MYNCQCTVLTVSEPGIISVLAANVMFAEADFDQCLTSFLGKNVESKYGGHNSANVSTLHTHLAQSVRCDKKRDY